jgi:hypothetical protein
MTLNCSILNFLIYEENLIFAFISASKNSASRGITVGKEEMYLLLSLKLPPSLLTYMVITFTCHTHRAERLRDREREVAIIPVLADDGMELAPTTAKIKGSSLFLLHFMRDQD